jgi:hypothetical protein
MPCVSNFGKPKGLPKELLSALGLKIKGIEPTHAMRLKLWQT